MRRRDFFPALGCAAAAISGGHAAGSTQDAKDDETSFDVAAADRKLAEHRIAKIESRRLQDRFPRNIGPNSRGRPVGRGGSNNARIVTTDQGVTGWCLGGGQAIDPKPLIGRKVGDLFDVEGGKADDVPWWLDKTLHDLAARILGVPVWKMIGAHGEREVRVYSGAIYMEDVVPQDRPRGVKAVIEACRQDHEAGYRAFKLKIGRGRKWMNRKEGLQRDIDVTKAVAEAFPDSRVLVDANDAYTVDEAVKFVKATSDTTLYWIEEAFEENIDGYRRLREAMADADSKAYIADGEARRDRAGEKATIFGDYSQAFVDRIFELAEERLIDICVMDLDIVGFSRWRQLMPKLVDAGVAASPHAWMWCLRTHQCAQLAGGVGNIPIVEGIPGTTSGVDLSQYKMREGMLVLPDAPGFGMELT